MPGAGGVQQSLGVYNGETTRAGPPARLTQRPAPRRTLTLGCAAVCLQSCPRVTAITIVSFGGGGAGGDDGGRLRQTPQLDSHFSANVSILHLTSLSKKVPIRCRPSSVHLDEKTDLGDETDSPPER